MTKTQKSTANAEDFLAEMDKLSAEREKFEKGLQARSNKQLYEICAAIYTKYVNIMDNNELLKASMEALIHLLSQRGFRVQKNSSALSVFVRYVFNSERQSTYVYTRALQYLLSENVKPGDAAKYIEDMGGVDQCFKARAPSKEQVAKKELIKNALPLVEDVLENSVNPIAKFSVKPEYVADTYKDEYTFAICRADKNGNIQVLSVIPKTTKTMTNIAKNALAEFMGKQKSESDAKQKATRKANVIEKATAKAKVSGTETVEEVLA